MKLFICAFVFLINYSIAFSPPPLLSSTSCSSTSLDLYRSVEEAIAEAQRICAIDPTSNECRVAWDIVVSD